MTRGRLDVLINGSATKKYIHKNVTYIEGRKNSEYKLRYFNDSNKSVEVIFSVDGLDVLYGKPAGPETRGYLVKPWASIEVPGWRIDDTKVAAFKFRPQGDSEDKTYVESLKEAGFSVDTANQGIIGVMVFPEKYIPPRIETLGPSYTTFGVPGGTIRNMSYNSIDDRPRGLAPSSSVSDLNWADASASASLSLTQEKSLGTGWGKETAYNTSKVEFERASFYTPDVIYTITYDTLTGLKRRGVPVEEIKHVANAFPAYRNDGCYVPKK